MLKLALVLSSTIVLTGLASFTVAHAQGPAPGQAPALPPPPLQCINQAQTVRIEAVADTLGNFPVPVSCPPNSLGAVSCLKWSYKYTLLSGNNISLSAITVDSDVDIVSVTGNVSGGVKVYDPGASDSSIGSIGLNTFDLRTVKFSANGNVVLGNVFTKTNVGIGSVTAISKVGNSGASTCRIAGPDNIEGGASVGVAAVTTTQVDQFQECTITLTLDAKGCPSDIQASPSTCQITEVDSLSSDTKKVLGGQCKGGTSGLVTEGSTCIWYCPTSFGTCFKVCK